MATTTGRIARDLMSEPHIVGRRVSVIQIYDKVNGRGDSPERVAEAFNLDIADVHHALAFYCKLPRPEGRGIQRGLPF